MSVYRQFGWIADATSGGSTIDDLDLTATPVIPNPTTFWPVTGGTFDPNIERIDRNNEARGRRAATPPLSFRAGPQMTVPIAAYPSVLSQAVVKCFGATDSVTGSAGAGYKHTMVPATNPSVLAAVNAQLVRDSLNTKMTGAYFNRVSMSFPLDGEGTVECELWGKYSYHADSGTEVPPSVSFSGLSTDPLMLRDAQMYIDDATGSEADEVDLVTVTGGPAGGTFTLTYSAQTTTGIAFNAAATAVQSALEALSNLVPGDVSVSGSAGGPYTIHFEGNKGSQSITLTGSGAGLTGGTSPDITIARTITGSAGGTTIPNLTGFDFSYNNNLTRRWYARRNVGTTTYASPHISQRRKIWYPTVNKLTGQADVTFSMSFGDPDVANEIALNYSRITKLVFECFGNPISGSADVSEMMRITIYNGVYTDGGADALAARDDISASFQGGAFYSEADSKDVQVEFLNATSSAIT